MFYSQLVLSKKGTFGSIWVAAHCPKRLKKDQVHHTNISSSVDKILKDGVPVMTYRILAFLLLGVVRIYSKKMEFLLHDFRGALTEISHFASNNQQTSTILGDTSAPESIRKNKASTSSVETLCAPYPGITVPLRFELDSFDLEIVDGVRGDHVNSREDITLKDTWEYGRSGHHSLQKDQSLKDIVLFEDHHESFSLPPEFRCNLSPACVEKLRDDNILLEDRLEPMILSDGEESEFGEHGIGGDHVNFSLPEMIIEERSEFRGSGSSYCTEGTSQEKAMPLEMNSEETGILHASPDNHVKFSLPEMIVEERSEMLHASPDNCPVSTAIDVTPEPKMQNKSGPSSNAGAITPESMAVRTPALKERPRILRKRKCTFDEIIVVPNNVYKGWINDQSDLVRKRRKVPHTTKHVWKVHQMSNLPQCFLEPLIPIVPIDVKSLTSKKKLVVPEPPETMEMLAKSDDLNPIKTSVTPVEPDFLKSPSREFPEEEIIAPSTPITRSTSVRFSEFRVPPKPNEVGPTSSLESIEKDISLSENRALDTVLIDEEEVNSIGNNQEQDKLSARTRNVARYLHMNFADREKRGTDEALSLFQVLKGKTKKESARLFYEILVMKTGGYVDVKQEKAYGDISVKECPKLKQACEVDLS